MMNVNKDKCIGCGLCVKDCFARDINIIEGKAEINNVTCFKCGHCIAICPKNAILTDEYDMEDVKDYNKEEFSIEADNLLNFIKFRRSVRYFKNKNVEDEKLLKIIEAGRFTQTGSNSQNVSYIVVRDGIEELKGMALESLNDIGQGILSNLNPQTMPFKRYAEMWAKMYEGYKANPTGRESSFSSTRKRLNPFYIAHTLYGGECDG